MSQNGGCKKLKYTPWSPRAVRCNRAVTGDHGFCAIHSPEAVARRDAKKHADWAARQAVWERQCDAKAERERRLAVFPELLAALKTVLAELQAHTGTDEWACEMRDVCLDAIAKAEGK